MFWSSCQCVKARGGLVCGNPYAWHRVLMVRDHDGLALEAPKPTALPPSWRSGSYVVVLLTSAGESLPTRAPGGRTNLFVGLTMHTCLALACEAGS
jgi:hypothetical protein